MATAKPARGEHPLAGLLEVEAILALGSLIAFSGALAVVLYDVVPPENEKYVMLMLGALIGVVKDTFGRYFQATKGAQDQRREFADLAQAAVTTPQPPPPPPPAGTASITAAPDVDITVRHADEAGGGFEIPPKPGG